MQLAPTTLIPSTLCLQLILLLPHAVSCPTDDELVIPAVVINNTQFSWMTSNNLTSYLQQFQKPPALANSCTRFIIFYCSFSPILLFSCFTPLASVTPCIQFKDYQSKILSPIKVTLILQYFLSKHTHIQCIMSAIIICYHYISINNNVVLELLISKSVWENKCDLNITMTDFITMQGKTFNHHNLIYE